MTLNQQENEGMDRKVPPIDFPTVLAGAENFHDIQERIIRQLDAFRIQGIQKIGFVSGGVPSRKDEKILAAYTEKIRGESEFPVFSSTDIFKDRELWDRLPEPNLPEAERKEKFLELFRKILAGGVTHIFMTPGWKSSIGAKDEHDTAEKLGINIDELLVDERISSL